MYCGCSSDYSTVFTHALNKVLSALIKVAFLARNICHTINGEQLIHWMYCFVKDPSCVRVYLLLNSLRFLLCYSWCQTFYVFQLKNVMIRVLEKLKRFFKIFLILYKYWRVQILNNRQLFRILIYCYWKNISLWLTPSFSSLALLCDIIYRN